MHLFSLFCNLVTPKSCITKNKIMYIKKLLASITALTFLSAVSFGQFTERNIGSTSSSFETVKFIDANNGFATGSSGDVYKTNDGGGSWTQTTSPNGGILFGSSIVDANTWFVSGTGGTLYKTTDAGQSWSKANHSDPDCIYAVVAVNSTTVYAGGWGGKILKSTDGGDNFTVSKTDNGSQYWVFTMAFTDANTGYAAGENGTVYKTTDGASSWNLLYTGTSQMLRAMDFPTSLTGYVVGWYGTVIKTTDAGSNWSTLSTGYPNDNYYGVYFSDASNGYVVGSYYKSSGFGGTWEGVIMKTTDGGTNWTREYTGGKELHAIFENAGVITAVGSDERIISNGSFTTSLKENTAGLNLNVFSYHRSLNISFDIENSALATVEIFDQLGSKIADVMNNQFVLGAQRLTWDASTLAKGVYFVRLSSSNGAITKKIIIAE